MKCLIAKRQASVCRGDHSIGLLLATVYPGLTAYPSRFKAALMAGNLDLNQFHAMTGDTILFCLAAQVCHNYRYHDGQLDLADAL